MSDTRAKFYLLQGQYEKSAEMFSETWSSFEEVSSAREVWPRGGLGHPGAILMLKPMCLSSIWGTTYVFSVTHSNVHRFR